MFSVLKLQINRGTTTANSQGGNAVTVTHTYKDTTLTVAAIKLLFPDYLGQGALQEYIYVGDHMLVEGSDTTIYCKILSLAPFTLDVDLFSGASGLSIGPTITAVDNNAARIIGDTLQMEKADKTHSGIVTETTQDIGGEKTFWANTTIIPNNDFVVPPPALMDFVVKTQQPIGGFQVQTDDPANLMVYSFGSTTLGGNYAGLVFSENGFGLGTPLLALGVDSNPPALAINNVPEILGFAPLKIDVINELTPTNGTVINGANLVNGGIQFLPTQTLLRTYIEDIVNITFTNGSLTTAPVPFKIIKIGNTVTITAMNVGSTGAQATPGTSFFSNTPLLLQYRPPAAVTGYWRVFNDTTGSVGMIRILIDGTIFIYNNADESTAFTASVNNIFDTGTFTYNLNS